MIPHFITIWRHTGESGEARTDGPGILHIRRPTRAKLASEFLYEAPLAAK